MPSYLVWDEKITTGLSASDINSLYNRGYLFTRKGKGVMNQTRSVRIDLDRFKLTSENKRILRKTKNLTLSPFPVPLSSYNWSIGKMAKDFYDTKFGAGTFSANKVRELLTTEHNFNILLKYSNIKILDTGYWILFEN